MKSIKKIDALKGIISDSLDSLINNNYVFLDLPYYSNVGDVLIWQGTLDYLKTLPYNCLSRKTYYTDSFNDLSPDTIILLQGGGNFGDLWREHQEYRLEMIRRYPNNRIIILPQSINYDNHELLMQDAHLFAKHTDLYICARDQHSYNLVKTYFKNNVLLVPDMAFFIDRSCLHKSKIKSASILVERQDLESKNELLNFKINESFDVSDWPSMTTPSLHSRLIGYLRALSSKLNVKVVSVLINNIIDQFAYSVYREHILISGQNFLAPYSKVYTTRLHAAILSILYEKEIVFIDNSYGKNSRFYDTWLSDLSNVKMIR